MLTEAFSDYFAQRKNFFTKIEPRWKALFTMAVILSLLVSKSPWPSLVMLSLALICLLSIRVPFKIILARLVCPLGLAGGVLLIQTFFYGETTIFTYRLWRFVLEARLEGLERGLLILTKILGTTSAVLFLSMTTPFNKLLEVASRLRLPKVWIEICLFAYRYVFMLLEDATVVWDAQRVRLGHCGLLRTLRSLGTLAGTIVIRAYDQSKATYEAMMVRGYECRKKR